MKNFTQIENNRIEGQEVSDGAFRTYSVLRRFKYGNGKVFPSLDTLAKRRGKTRKTISTHVKELREKGWIASKKRGYSMSNLYTFIGVENLPSKVKKSSAQYTRNLHPNNTRVKNTEDNNIDFGNLPALEEMRKTLISRKLIRN